MGKIDQVDEAFEKGYEAGRKGKKLSSNPFQDPMLHDEWLEGHETATEEKESR